MMFARASCAGRFIRSRNRENSVTGRGRKTPGSTSAASTTGAGWRWTKSAAWFSRPPVRRPLIFTGRTDAVGSSWSLRLGEANVAARQAGSIWPSRCRKTNEADDANPYFTLVADRCESGSLASRLDFPRRLAILFWATIPSSKGLALPSDFKLSYCRGRFSKEGGMNGLSELRECQRRQRHLQPLRR